jgi:hypothetical protein
MSRKLGEILVEGQHLSPADLKKALDAQMIFGGRLGTNLLDLGLLDEETLTRVLKEQRRVEVATPRMLEQASVEALRLVPMKIAARHHLVPFALEDKKLKVAMMDPTDLIAIDEVQFVTGCTVIPHLAPEVRVLFYLERFYGLQRPVRYIRLVDVDGPVAATPEPHATPASAAPAVAPARAQPAAAAPLVDLDALLGAPAPLPPLPAPAPERPLTLDEVARKLAEAEVRDDIGEVLVAFAARELPRVVAWIVQRDRALGWLGHVPGMPDEQVRRQVRQVAVPLEAPSVMADVVVSRRYYLGELPARPADDLLGNALGAPRAHQVLLLPVSLGDQVVIVLQADGAEAALGAFDLKKLRVACAKAELAMEVLLMRARIRQLD